MKVKIFKILKQYVLSTVLFSLLLFVTFFLPFSRYCSVIVMYVALNYYVLLGIIRMGGKDQSKESLYHWLDVLDGSEQFLKRTFIHEKSRDLITNLETVYDRLLILTNRDEKKLKLLKGYYKTLVDDGPVDLFFKTIIGILVAIVAWGINKGVVLGLAKINIKDVELLGIQPYFVVILNYVTFVILGSISFAVLIKNYYKEKTRNKIILEIIEVCQEQFKK
jgi:hypothetical protein